MRWNILLNINQSDLRNISKENNSKKNLGKSNSRLYTIFSNAIINLYDTVSNFTVYELANWISHSDKWLRNLNTRDNTKGYKRGSIIFIDLGAENYGHEPSYTHPAVVLDETKTSVFIAPCSSKKFGSNLPDVIDVTTLEGFSSNTGIQVGNVRWISKKRIISELGKTTSSVLDDIDAFLLKSIPLYQKEILLRENKIKDLEKEMLLKENMITDLKKDIELLKNGNNSEINNN